MSAVLLTPSAAHRRPTPAPALLPPLRVAFAGGGTGGHLFPAVAIARELLRAAPGSEVCFLGSDRPLERRILDEAGFTHHALPCAAWPGLPRSPRGAARAARFGWAQLRGLLAARAILRAFRPDVVVGLGGFPSVPGVLAARTLRVPVALFEPNAAPGQANVVLARFAREAYVHFQATPLRCPRVATGTPLDGRACAAASLAKDEARARLGLPRGQRTVLVTGGSQGARALNAWVASSLATLPEGTPVSFVHLAGSEDEAATLRAAYAAAGLAHHVTPFLSEIGVAYRAADVAVVRGGGATLAELLAVGLPALVVPLPRLAGDHQGHNARAFASTGAGEWIEERALAPEVLRRVVDLAQDEAGLARRRGCALASGRPLAARAVARRLARLAGYEVGPEGREEERNGHG